MPSPELQAIRSLSRRIVRTKKDDVFKTAEQVKALYPTLGKETLRKYRKGYRGITLTEVKSVNGRGFQYNIEEIESKIVLKSK
jgi:hypothetical protein